MIGSQEFRQFFADGRDHERFFGVVVGIVTNNQDPDGMHRVKVRFPWLSDGAQDESYWARVATPMAGNDRGAYFLPEVDDEVLVAFDHGAVDHPYVIGSLWNGKDAPPESNGDGDNNHRGFKSRSGHIVRLNDQRGSETIEIIDKTGNNRIVISSSENKIVIQADGDIEIKSTRGKLTMSAIGVEIKSQAGVDIQAMQNVDVKATAQVNVRGTLVNLN
ncbi:MAG: phage baseplate assembly protein V [Burkholderiaceae bacterium]